MTSIDHLKKRSQALKTLRAFFYARSVMEVDTPILSSAATPDLHLRSLSTQVQVPGEADPRIFYLHTSPEYPMKRLLCAGSGDIFYLGKVFRDGDVSRRHQVEFTLLEWYRLGFDLRAMMDETVKVVQSLLGDRPVEMISYEEAFESYAGLEAVHDTDAKSCQACLAEHRVPEIVGVDADDKPLWEQLVLTEVIEPQLGRGKITCLYHYPSREAALAQLHPQDERLALRFEVFVDGMELANGYQELADADEYRRRFEADLAQRSENGLPNVPMDEALLSALAVDGLPACSGVALGVDRLLMLAFQADDIRGVLPFSIEES
ncbi:EF-P lysine aminoacylase EpmA [Hydrogenovibrio thermophilus]|uniref:EF-P lysine aminoacylase GenX n=1 Tax=Hydrogenovibrio thermophilus TaxID=265883 RepID=A0A410H4L0_9GAMM|nr:EF-P lysine aminoacylase EpmA [Hydrogenovibrio thermophilus]QAB15863.1 EF-P lysine aminoacylase GenX [Hydrogenovibrio thermophilus]